jgi:cytochrome c5
MNYAAAFLIVAATSSLLACGKSEEVPAPAIEPPAAQTPLAEAAPEPAAPLDETPAAEIAPAETLPEAPAAGAAAPQPVAPAAPAAAPARPPAPAPTAAPAPEPEPAPAAQPAADLAHGQQIYRQACAFCHDKGVAGSPATGDAAAWAPRLAQGMETLYTVAVRGKGAMPAKGGNPALSDADVKAAVDYMVAQSR